MAKEARARSSVIDAEDVTAALARRELVQHGARSVAVAEGRTTTRQSVGRLLRCKQEQGKGKSPGKNGKAKAKHTHSVVFKTVPSAEGTVSGLEERASTSNSVTSEPSVSLSLEFNELTRSFQQETDSPGMIGIHDDVIIYGYMREDHDSNLINFLNVCQMEGLCLSSKKLELRRDKVSFGGAIYSREGVHPDPKKVQGIEEMTAPETKQQLQSFLGMVTYMPIHFIPHLSHHTELLRQLLKKDVTFYWDDQLTRSFQEIKHLLKKQTSKPLGYYDRRKEVIVQGDASLRGLGTCLIQDGKPIAFASKSLTGVESRYANIERKLLAVVFACIRFNTYLQGRRFTVQSDHKPLEMIHLKSMHNAPPRLQRMLLQLQKYDMKIA